MADRTRVAVAGAAGRMGEAVCAAVTAAPGMELVARADPTLGVSLAQALALAPDVLVDFTVPTAVVGNAHEAVAAGVHVVIGATGFELSDLQDLSGAAANVFIAPNFAVGAVLMMRFAAQAAVHMARAEIIELHHDRKLDAPSGTAARTARLMERARAAAGGAGPAGASSAGEAGAAGASSAGEAGDVWQVPIHSVRLPGLVAHQEVILGDVGQTLTIRHDSIDRESFMPGVLLAVRRVGSLQRSPTVGLETLLFGD
jgi:4-hydroxy-tetrahydrodipicolinate reductase